MNVLVRVYDASQYGEDWPPEEIPQFVKWLEGKIAMIPEQFREKATIEIGSEGGYEGDFHANIEISYIRPETPLEKAEREELESIREKQREAREREHLAALKAKYEKEA